MWRNAARWVRVTKAAVKGLQFAAQQISYLGKTADTAVIFPYGTHANVPPGNLGVMFAIQGNTDNRAAILTSINDRPELAESEVAFYHPATRSILVWREDGSLEVTTQADVTLNAAKLTVNVPDIVVNGNAAFNGTVAIAGKLSANGGADLGTGGAGIARVGDQVDNGVIVTGSSENTSS